MAQDRALDKTDIYTLTHIFISQMGTKEFCKMMKTIQTLEEGRVPAREAKKWRIEGEKKRISRKEHKRLLNNFEMEGSVAQKGLWNLAKGGNHERKRTVA